MKKLETILVIIFGLGMTAFIYREPIQQITNGEKSILSSALPKVLEKENEPIYDEKDIYSDDWEYTTATADEKALSEKITISNSVLIKHDTIEGYTVKVLLEYNGESLYDLIEGEILPTFKITK